VAQQKLALGQQMSALALPPPQQVRTQQQQPIMSVVVDMKAVCSVRKL
jgi:hypothetical protein